MTDRNLPARANEVRIIGPDERKSLTELAEEFAAGEEMVPEAYRGKPAKVKIALYKGWEIRLSPMQSLQSIAVIGSMPAIWGDAIPALLFRAGHHIDFRLDGDPQDPDTWVAVAWVIRGDTGRKIERTFSYREAIRMGLVSRWQKRNLSVRRMLGMRARAFAARDGAADAMMGLQVAEELQDYEDITPPGEGNPQATETVMARRMRGEQDPVLQPQEARDAGGYDLPPNLKSAIEDAEIVDDEGSGPETDA